MKKRLFCFVFCVLSLTISFAQTVQTHTVKRGETIESIAQKYGVTVNDIKEANPDVGRFFFVGMKLNIPISIVSNETPVKSINDRDTTRVVISKPTKEEGEIVEKPDNKENTYLSDDHLGGFNFSFYTFKGGNNFGFSGYIMRSNNVGGEFSIRSNFKLHGNFNFDLGINYSFELWRQDKCRLFFVVAAGPSFRCQDVLDKLDVTETAYGTVIDKSKYKTKFYCDFYFNPRLAFNVGKFNLSAGYFLWAGEWKFSDGAALHGFQASIGYDF